jgi:hypothetical protein
VLNAIPAVAGAVNSAYLSSSLSLVTPSVTTTLGVGGATPAASGAGITFPATQSASTDANTLDDYEEGTWTPTIVGTGGSIGSQAYSLQSGRYVKIGRFVLLTGYLVLTNKGSWTGDVEIQGFPFTVTNETASYSAHNFYYGAVTLPANNFALGAYVNIGSTSARVWSSNNTGTTNSDYSIVNNNTQIGPWQFCYFTSA